MTTLLLIRHGETDWNVERRYQGQDGPGLNARGREQAREAARTLLAGAAQPRVEAIVSSDLPRALETAQIIGEALGLPVTLDPRLRERHVGEWTGRYGPDVEVEYADVIAAWVRDPLGVCPPGGETGREIARRTVAVLNDLAAQYLGGRVIVVTHGGIMAFVRCMAQSLPPTDLRFQGSANAEIQTVEWPLTGSLADWIGDARPRDA